MYKHLQLRAKEHIIKWLNDNPDSLVFDIDTSNLNNTIIKCHSPIESIDIVFGEIAAPKYVMKTLGNKLGISLKNWIWVDIVRYLFRDIFKIYGVKMFMLYNGLVTYTMMDIESQIYGVFNENTKCYDIVSPQLRDYDYYTEKLVNKCPFLILLDPLEYFHFCEQFKNQYMRLDHTLGIYNSLLSHFLKMDNFLFRTFLVAYTIFQSYCPDISFLVLLKLIDLS